MLDLTFSAKFSNLQENLGKVVDVVAEKKFMLIYEF